MRAGFRVLTHPQADFSEFKNTILDNQKLDFFSMQLHSRSLDLNWQSFIDNALSSCR